MIPHLLPVPRPAAGGDPLEDRVADRILPLEEAGDPLLLLAGVPFDTTTMGRAGSRHAPAAIRAALSALLAYHAGFDVDLAAAPPLADCGDVAVVNTDVEETWRRISEVVAALAERERPLLLLGGDHGMSFPALRGVLRPGRERLGVIVLDAHYDLRPSHHGQPASGVPFRYALERLDGRIAARNLTQIGIAGWENTAAAAAYARDKGIRSFSARDVHRGDLDAIAAEACERALDGTDGVWLSVDIDAADAAFAPGTNAPTSGGLTSHQLLELVWRIGALPEVVGMDLVEVSPPLDPSGVTAQLAATVALTFAAARHAGGG